MLIATETTVYRTDAAAGGPSPAECFRHEGIRRVAEGSRIAVVALADGALVVLDQDEREEIATGIEEPIESLLLLSDEPLELLVGTEAPHLYRVEGREVRRNESFAALSCRGSWHTPWGGPAALRSLAATTDGCAYADIHVGSIMRSADRGATWEPVTPDLHEDVHQVATCRAAPARLYAATARAVYVSDDRGQSWHHRAADLDERYGRAIVVAPDDPDLILTTVSNGPHGENVHGQLFRTDDAGRTWRHVAEGFPASTEQNINTFHVAFTPDGLAWAAVGPILYVGEDRATRWRALWTAPEPILMLACRSEQDSSPCSV